ncbi:hypothetical protein UFOVP95_43 [uncultured Caudovirales phage]|uniref:Uncharacterized protein n=1 Tax=uncultured Caudovirales phage TaxID=2100421 RepID=A0A6J5KYQ8_9CAUD|nr:hypothetical protein UFOVP95_43 [uncultured Caudovirales phage]
MTLQERRKAVKAQLDKAVTSHKKRAQLTREYTILTAGLLAEKLEAEKTWPRLEPCSTVNPGLWASWCIAQGRSEGPSEIWTEFDVVEHIVRKQAGKLQEAPRLS